MMNCVRSPELSKGSCAVEYSECICVTEDSKPLYHVLVEDQKIKKPFLGGWRNNMTQVEYFNAESQTGWEAKKMSGKKNVCSIGVQYIVLKDRNTQTMRTTFTQMWRPDFYVSSKNDQYKTAKPYETYDEMQQRLDPDGKARIIQRNYRAYRLRKFIKESSEKFRDIANRCKKLEEEKARKYRARHRSELLAKMYPKKRSDFEMLYELIDKWRRDRFYCAKLYCSKEALRAKNFEILLKTVEMFSVVERKRYLVKDEYEKRRRAEFITRNCRPITWTGYKNKNVEMITTKTKKAWEVKSVLDSLMDNDVTMEERSTILLHLRSIIREHGCMDAIRLIALLDQEINLLVQHVEVEASMFQYLRERIICLYLHFVRASQSCGCDNAREEFIKDELREPLEPKTKLCKSCLKLLPLNKFAVHSRLKKISICTGCTWLKHRSLSHACYDPYMQILNILRAEEIFKKSTSAFPFLMQEEDVYHLVNNIWHGQSVVSENRDLWLLRLIRYNMTEDWSPWNCILLTDEEAQLHSKIRDLPSIYSVHLRRKVSLAHQLAKNQFQQLGIFERSFRESSSYDVMRKIIDELSFEDLSDTYSICNNENTE